MPSQEEHEELQTRRRKRCYHRVISGLEKGGDLRIITLTSSDDAPWDIQRSFRKLIMRLRRRQLCQDYLKVIEVKDDGREHIHMCFRGQFIEQTFLSELWREIHQSPIVDIRRVKKGNKNKRGVAGYLAKYMAKEIFRRYSWSWGWVYKGFVKTWQSAKHIVFWNAGTKAGRYCFDAMLHLWKVHIRNDTDPEFFLCFLKIQTRILNERFDYSSGAFSPTAHTVTA